MQAQDGARRTRSQAHSPAAAPSPPHSQGDSEYTFQLTKADLDESLTLMYDKIAQKFQSELLKSTNTLSLEIAALGSRTDLLETKHDELTLVYSDLRKEHESLSETVQQLQAHIEDLDNRNRRNNLRVRGVPESVTDLLPTVQKIFQSLLPDSPLSAFSCDRIHRALRPPPEKPPWDIVLCLKDFLIKEEILRASRNTPNIRLEGTPIQIYPDISPTTLDKRRRMKEVTAVLQNASIRYRWGFPFKLQVPHNGTTYTVTTLIEGKELLVKLGLLDAASLPRLPSTPRHSAIWATPPTRRDRRDQHRD